MLLAAGPARAWQADLRVAGCDVVVGSSVFKGYEPTINATITRCPTSGCALMCHLQIPRSATTPVMAFNLQYLGSEVQSLGSTLGTVQICTFAALPNQTALQQVQNVSNFACLPAASLAYTGQWQLRKIDTTNGTQPWDGGIPIGLTPKFLESAVPTVCGTGITPGGAAQCDGADLYVAISFDGTTGAGFPANFTNLSVFGR